MLNLPGLNSYRKGVRIFARIYYVFLVLLFAVLMFRSRRGIGAYDKFINIIEMLLLWLAFASPAVIAAFTDKRGLGGFAAVIAGSLAVMIFIAASVCLGNLYTDEYKQTFGISSEVSTGQ